MNKNKGYSLVELIISMAIMATLATVSFVTIGILNNARAKDVSSKLDTQLHSLWVTTNSTSPDRCIKLDENDDDGYFLQYGTYDGTTFVSDVDSNGDEIVEKLNNRIVIEYVVEGAGSTDGIIQFKKADGSVKSGAGTYNIYLRASDNNEDYSGRLMASVILKESTGSHYIK